MPFHALFEVFCRGGEEFDVVVAGDVFVEAVCPALRVAHLAEDSAVRGGDALDRQAASVRVEVDVRGGVAGKVHVLRGDLAVCLQLRVTIPLDTVMPAISQPQPKIMKPQAANFAEAGMPS